MSHAAADRNLLFGILALFCSSRSAFPRSDYRCSTPWWPNTSRHTPTTRNGASRR